MIFISYRLIIMIKENEDQLDQFQEFKQQYLTYSQMYKNSPTFQVSPPSIPHKFNEKQKLKMISQTNTDFDLLSKFNRPPEKRLHISSGKILGVGDAIFKSNFQSGNINQVKKLTPYHYEITLQKQTNSNRTSSWFYFACEGLKGEIMFTVRGFSKKTSLHNAGMKICYREGHEGKWRRGCSKISYQCDESVELEKESFILRFTFFFRKSSFDSVEFAYCFPYTFTNLLKFLSLYKSQLNIQNLGTSFYGRNIPLVTIGNENSSKVIILSSRVHPGETVGSLMMEGFIKQLLSSSIYSEILRKTFLFKIVPMINPDGVIHGNYRFSGAGYDLNRKWKCCEKGNHSQIYYLKEMIKQISSTKEVLMYIDLHGHSRQKNIFFYGCCQNNTEDRRAKQFPFLMSKIHSGISYNHCSYLVQKQKEGTARVVMWKFLGIPYIYTMEASFFGSEKKNYEISDYENVGASLCEGMCLNFWNYVEENKKKFQLEFENKMKEFYQNPMLRQVEFHNNESDSEPEGGEAQKKKQISIKKVKKTDIKFFKVNDKFYKNCHENLQKSLKKSTNLTDKIARHTEKSMQRSVYDASRKNKLQDSFLLKTQAYTPMQFEDKMKSIINSKKVISEYRQKIYEGNLSPIIKDQSIQKKTVSYEGAQYRRVRKIVQDNNRSSLQSVERKDNMVVGLTHTTFKQFEKLKIKQKNRSMFPFANTKIMKGNHGQFKVRQQKIEELMEKNKQKSERSVKLPQNQK